MPIKSVEGRRLEELQAILAKSDNPEARKEALELAKELVYKTFPSKKWKPNVMQLRMLEPWRKPPYPFIEVAAPGNGAGKTNALVAHLVGIVIGGEYLSDFWGYDENGKPIRGSNFEYYKQFKQHRDAGTLAVRVLCDKEDLKESGSFYKTVFDFFSKEIASFTSKTSGGYYVKLQIKHPTIPGITNFIDIKTFDQDITAHAGVNLHVVLVNEPPRYNVWSETIGRTRSKADEMPCCVLMAATAVRPEDAWIWDIVENTEDGYCCLVRGSTWENCKGEEITDAIAKQLFEKTGVKLKKNHVGEGYYTNGVLSRRSIENQIMMWRKTGEDEIKTWGVNPKKMSRIYTNFSPAVHVKTTVSINKTWPVVQVVDPHQVRDDAAIWVQLQPADRLLVFHEFPEGKNYIALKDRTITVEQTCDQWRRYEDEAGISKLVMMRIGDPNRFRARMADNLKTVADQYRQYGFSFNLNVPDNLDYGHREVQSKLFYDEKQNIEPKLTIFEDCINTWTALTRYMWKTQSDYMKYNTEKIDQTYKDFADVIRYLCVVKLEFSFMYRKLSSGSPDYIDIVKSRHVDETTLMRARSSTKLSSNSTWDMIKKSRNH